MQPAARQAWGPAATAIPDRLSRAPGRWQIVDMPDHLAAHAGHTHVDMADPAIRRRVLPVWLETGPPGLLAATVTFPQLRAEWPHLPLPLPLRQAWEDCYPALADDDTGWQHPTLFETPQMTSVGSNYLPPAPAR